MNKTTAHCTHFLYLPFLALFLLFFSLPAFGAEKTLAYLVSDTRIPFWEIMSRGIQQRATALGYQLEVHNAENSSRRELEAAAQVLATSVSGIILSPTNSSSCVTLLKLAQAASVPVVIADIGTDSGEYVSYISSDNRTGAYQIGQVLVKKMVALNWQRGRVGIVAIPQKRLNGQARTAGFMTALEEAGIKGASLQQQVTFSENETYRLSRQMIEAHPDLRALWLQGSDRYSGALKAIQDTGRAGEVLLLTFDAEPEFLTLIPDGVILGAAMQQPYLMGEQAVAVLDQHLQGQQVKKNIKLPVLAISTDNIVQNLPLIKRNVLGLFPENEAQ